MDPQVVDLRHLEIPGAIGVYVVDGPEPALIDPGPAISIGELEQGLAELGVGWRDVRQVLLTHIHLDHAGATGAIIRKNPEATVFVHEDGAPHLVDPSRLVASTARTFGEGSNDVFWGETLPVPAGNVKAWRPGEGLSPRGFRPIHSPGHIASHLAYQSEADGTLYSGDVMGIILHPKAPVHPPTPPPTADLAAWHATLEGWADLDVPRFAPTHFGFQDGFQERRVELIAALKALEVRGEAARGRGDVEEEAQRYADEVIQAISEGAPDPDQVGRYFGTFRADTDFRGLIFHLERRNRA